jgi:hypothetical protein
MMMPQGVESSGVASKISHVGTRGEVKEYMSESDEYCVKHGPNI